MLYSIRKKLNCGGAGNYDTGHWHSVKPGSCARLELGRDKRKILANPFSLPIAPEKIWLINLPKLIQNDIISSALNPSIWPPGSQINAFDGWIVRKSHFYGLIQIILTAVHVGSNAFLGRALDNYLIDML